VNIRERGYTLVELLVTLAISGLIFSVAGSAVYQLSTVSGYGNDLLTAGHELQNTAHWFNLDGQSAVRAEADRTLTYYLPDDRSITYSLSGTDLLRTEGTSRMTLAQNITSVNFSVDDRLVSLDITSSSDGREKISEQRKYQVYLRPVEQ
jgi:prepilin-type N-terminal cleavage/methylation domain-containing protein